MPQIRELQKKCTAFTRLDYCKKQRSPNILILSASDQRIVGKLAIGIIHAKNLKADQMFNFFTVILWCSLCYLK